MKTFAIALCSLVAATAGARSEVPCSGRGCGDELVSQGWKRIAECTGHNWSYLLQKGTSILVCTGVYGRAGPIEFPCEEFKGDLDQYQAITSKPPAIEIRADCVLSTAVTGAPEK